MAEGPFESAISARDAVKTIPDNELSRFGCYDPFVVCVNACTGTLIEPKAAPLVAEGQKVILRTIGWGTCRPKTVACTSDNVRDSNIALQPLPPAPPTDGGPQAADSALMKAARVRSLATANVGTAEATDIGTTATLRMAASDASVSAREAEAADMIQLMAVVTDAKSQGDPFGISQLLLAAALAPLDDAGASDCTAATTKATTALGAAQNSLTTIAKDISAFPPSIESLKEEVQSAVDVATTLLGDYKQVVASVCNGPLQARNVLGRAKRASDALSKVEAEAEAASASASEAADGFILSRFMDCVVTLPSDLAVRQVVVDVALTPRPPKRAGAEMMEDASAEAGSPDAPTTHALAYINISHGQYYYDIGPIVALVPYGQRTISTPLRPGSSGDLMISLDEHAAEVAGIAANFYPFGRSRDEYSVFHRPSHFYEAFGFQVAFNPDLKSLTSTVFGGLTFEPVSGVSLNGGLIVMQGDFLQAGYARGMSAPANRSDYVIDKPMLRGYVGLTIGYELFNTLTQRLPTNP